LVQRLQDQIIAKV